MSESPVISNETNPPAPPRSQPAVIPLLLAGIFMVVGICVLLVIGREKARIIGNTITDLDIQPLLNTEKAITEEDMRGKAVVLHFWGFWCHTCAAEYPDFVAVQNKYKDASDVLIVSISCSEKSNDTRDALGFYSKKFLLLRGGDEMPIYWDPAEFSRVRISQLLTAGGFSYPTTLVLDGEGKVVDVWRSQVSSATLEQAVEKARAQTRALQGK